MLELLTSDQPMPFLDQASSDILRWARETGAHARIGMRRWVEDEGRTFAFTWTGSRAHFTLDLLFRAESLEATNYGIAFGFDGNGDEARAILGRFLREKPDPYILVRRAFPKGIPPVGKHGAFLSEDLKGRAYVSKNLDLEKALDCAGILLANHES
jgi:hypothetical protein